MGQTERTGLPFMKMHGLGNDFVVVDNREGGRAVSSATAVAIADRHRGVGFDQLAVIEPAVAADARLTFLNADGSESAACGNATRCVARFLMDENGRSELRLETLRGVLSARDVGDGLTAVNMGEPLLNWDEVPLAEKMDTLHQRSLC